MAATATRYQLAACAAARRIRMANGPEPSHADIYRSASEQQQILCRTQLFGRNYVLMDCVVRLSVGAAGFTIEVWTTLRPKWAQRRRRIMKYVVSMTFRLNGSAGENEAAAKRILDLYSKWTPPEGSTFHQFVGRIDGGGTFAVIETDNPSDLADTTAKFGPYVDYQIYPVQDIADTVRAAQEGLAFRDSVS
jgi:hypothetical protein